MLLYWVIDKDRIKCEVQRNGYEMQSEFWDIRAYLPLAVGPYKIAEITFPAFIKKTEASCQKLRF